MKKEILSWIGCFAIAIIAALLIVTFVGQRVEVDGHSMETTLQDHDNLICDKLSYRFKDPERFDVVVIYPYGDQGDKSKRWIKRVIGLPGEEVRIDEQGNIYINGEILEENYGKEIIEDPGLAIEPIQLGEDEYWVMGDNRNHSSDSRVIGPVKRRNIVGKTFVRIYPFSKFGLIKHQ
ncbi:MAG: signal peptidase I [Eubacteriales bacterium]|nr:signal peptidase I [Eubacteriales bacterium]